MSPPTEPAYCTRPAYTRPLAHRFLSHQRGMTLIEAIITLTTGALLMLSLSGALGGTLESGRSLDSRRQAAEASRFALNRIERHLRGSPTPVAPMRNNSAPILAVVLNPELDTDGDGFADADNDQDGRSNEDPGADRFATGVNGLFGIDDDNDGLTDETDVGTADNDDEDGARNEDPANRIDDDGDGLVDEDTGADLNADGCSGICGVDDDADGSLDEGDAADDDEDGVSDEDWIDVITVQLIGQTLVESYPSRGAANGTNRVSATLAENVSSFTVTRTAQASGWEEIQVEMTLEIDGDSPLASQRTIFLRAN